MSENWKVRAEFLSELDEISSNIPWEGIGFDNPGALLLIDPCWKHLYSPKTAVFRYAPNGTIVMEVTYIVSGECQEYWLTPEELVKNLIAYSNEHGLIHCVNSGVVNDVLLKSTKAFSEAIGQPTTVKEKVCKNIVAEPKNELRPYWMP